LQPFDRELTALLPRLRRFAHALSRSTADADDLTQATAERILRSRHQWEPGTRFDAWAFRIMRNLWIDMARSRTRLEKRLAPEEAGMAVGHDPTEQLESRSELASVMAALARLPDEQREVVALVAVEGLSYGEVARLLDLPLGTVSTRVMRGRKALLAIIGARGHDR
jgi:RNA polymerase sigma factor (sigma-70 family)